MLNYIWAGMVLMSIITAVVTGNVEATASAALTGAKDAVEMSIGLLGVMCLWTGLMNIADKSGLVKIISKFIRPVIRLLFPEIPPSSPAAGAIVMNMVANMLGLANAATPLGLKAISELDRLNRSGSKTATNSMCMLVVINTASIQIVPATIMALRSATGSANPSEIISGVWIASICALLVGVVSAKILERRRL